MVRGDQFDTVVPESGVQFVRVVGVIADEILRSFRDQHLQEGGLRQLHFVRRGTFNGYTHWKAMAVCHGYDLRSLATFRFANLRSPFWREQNCHR